MRLKASDSERDSVRDHQRLGQAGHAFQHAVALAEERDEQLLDDLVLADDDAAQLFLDVVERLAQTADGFEIVLPHFGRCRLGCFVHGQGGSEIRLVHEESSIKGLAAARRAARPCEPPLNGVSRDG